MKNAQVLGVIKGGFWTILISSSLLCVPISRANSPRVFEIDKLQVIYNDRIFSVSNPGILVGDEGKVESNELLRLRLSSKESVEIPMPEFPLMKKSMSMDGFVMLTLPPRLNGQEMAILHLPSSGDPYSMQAEIKRFEMVVRYRFKDGKLISTQAVMEIAEIAGKAHADE